MRCFVATERGLLSLPVESGSEGTDFDERLGQRDVRAVAVNGDETWVVLEGRSIAFRRASGAWTEIPASGIHAPTCLLSSTEGLLVGTEEAHVLRLHRGALVPVDAFESVAGRDAWYTPWGGPAAVRSMTQDLAGRLHVNVHVGGIPRSLDAGVTWSPTIDIDADVHQVLAHPTKPNVVLASCALGLAQSDDGGESWLMRHAGLHATYSRAVAVAGDQVLVTASLGPRGGRSALYRSSLEPAAPFERVAAGGLPDWFDRNIDTGWLAAEGRAIAFASAEGAVYGSRDTGGTWELLAEGLPTVRWLTLVPD
jgi:hypothetical protein